MIRPLGLITSLWAFPATAAWAISLRTGGERFGYRRWIYLVPGLVAFFMEPFRERLLLMLLVPVVAALFAGRRLRLAVVCGVFVAFGLASTIAVGWYRQITWEGQTVRESVEVLDPQLWLKEPYHAPWTAVLRRFHSFDSLVFYVNLVPEVVGFETDRNPLADVALEGFVPRALYPDKPESRRAMIFSTTLWGYSDRGPHGVEHRALDGRGSVRRGWLVLGADRRGVLGAPARRPRPLVVAARAERAGPWSSPRWRCSPPAASSATSRGRWRRSSRTRSCSPASPR